MPPSNRDNPFMEINDFYILNSGAEVLDSNVFIKEFHDKLTRIITFAGEIYVQTE